MAAHTSAYLLDTLAGRDINLDAVKAALKAQRIETPSWGYANSGK
jgi:L-rhamnose isomerase / sugar isomerase